MKNYGEYNQSLDQNLISGPAEYEGILNLQYRICLGS
jgi:hypothetical protein